MLGAITGDVIGSRFTFNNIKTKKFELFDPSCTFTDDSILTIAVGMALIYDETEYESIYKSATRWMRNIGQKFPNAGYGNMFYDWLFAVKPKPYGSYGNGAPMRISTVGIVAKNEEEVKYLSKEITRITHNHEESYQAAEAIAMCIFLLKKGHSKNQIREFVNSTYYKLDFKLDEIRSSYRFTERAIDSTPEAIEAFLESTSFEDAIRNAISIGGDSDTIAAITGSLAEAHYGIPSKIWLNTKKYLDPLLINYIEEFLEKFAIRFI